LIACQDFLPFQPRRDPLVDLLDRHAETSPEDGPRVVLGLKQAGDEQRLEPPELLRLALAGYPVLKPGGVRLVAEAVADLVPEPH
jgi:hypothetical protein